MNSRLLLTFLSLFTFRLCCVDTTIPSPRWKTFYFVWSNFTGGLIIKTYWQNFENLNCLLAWTVVWEVLEYVLGLRELHIVISVVLFVLKFSRSVAQQLRGVRDNLVWLHATFGDRETNTQYKIMDQCETWYVYFPNVRVCNLRFWGNLQIIRLFGKLR